MLKLLLSHWHAHREPPPFVLTDDPLYCAHISTNRGHLPEVYSVNRVNPIFEDTEDESYVHHKRSPSEEQRENETKSSDDTGYVSGQRQRSTAGDFTDVGSFDHQMSTDSDEPAEAVVVSADVHRVSFPDDVIILSSNRNSFSLGSSSLSSRSSFDSESSGEPFDSLSSIANTQSSKARRPSVRMERIDRDQTEVKRPITNGGMAVRDKIQRLLEKGTQNVLESQLESNDVRTNGSVIGAQRDPQIEKSKDDLIKSLNRVLNNKVPKVPEAMTRSENVADENTVTRTDSSSVESTKKKGRKKDPSKYARNSSSPEKEVPPPPPPPKPSLSTREGAENGVTRQDESSASSLDRSSKQGKKHRHRHHHYYETRHRDQDIDDMDHFAHNREFPHHCKICDDVHKLTLHQFLPGHWSYDNIYLPQMPGVCYHCLHQHHHHHQNGHPRLLPTSENDLFYPMYYQQGGKVRHSWAPYSSQGQKDNHRRRQHISSSNEGTGSDNRYSPDGSSHETENEGQHDKTKEDTAAKSLESLSQRRSLRVPKKCKCEACLAAALDSGEVPQCLGVHPCTCSYLPHRRVKFASDTDLTRHANDGESPKLPNGEHPPLLSINPANLPRLEPHLLAGKVHASKDDIAKLKLPSPLVSRGQKEPVKVDDLYRSYPMDFQDWETLLRRKVLRKRRKRALNMVGMAIGIILVVGVAIAMTFIFLRLKRPT